MKKLSPKLIYPVLTIVLLTLYPLAYANDIDSLSIEDGAQEIIIQEKKDSRIQEFKSNGQVYMIKITPKKGFPYYLVDTDGDGILESRKNGMEPNLLIPSWVIFSW